MFYIKKVGLSGRLGDSPLDLTKGLNVVIGSSNTGKSIIVECIDYALGDKEQNIELEGYSRVYVVLQHEKGEVKITRNLGSKKVQIDSENFLVESGEYATTKGQGDKESEVFLDDILLRLMDVTPRQDIVISKDWKKQNFTFRTCLNSFIVKQENIIRRESPYLPINTFAQKSYRPGLLFLWSGDNFLNDGNKASMQARKTRKRAIESYINELLAQIQSQRDELEKKASIAPEDVEAKIEETLRLISENEFELNNLLAEQKEIAGDIIQLNDEITESENLLIKYEALNTQYEADKKRLEFIIEGEAIGQSHTHMEHKCPFCNGVIEKSVEDSCIEAASKELLNLIPKIKDLNDTKTELTKTLEELRQSVAEKQERKSQILNHINNEIKPLIANLKSAIEEYRTAIEDYKEATMLLAQEDTYKKKMAELAVELKDENRPFHVMGHFQDIIANLENEYNRLLNLGNYSFVKPAVFENFDYVIDGKHKNAQGQGFRAYLNGLSVLALYNILYGKGQYPMPFLIMDSPIQSLVENKDIAKEKSMRIGLFKCLEEARANMQIIVVENRLPEYIDSTKMNLISFTKDEQTGRYGFAKGIKK